LIGRLAQYKLARSEYPENEVFQRYFEDRLKVASYRSGIRTKELDAATASQKAQAAPVNPGR
jgi:hypothetical protein